MDEELPSLSTVAAAICAAETTTLRHIDTLVREGLIRYERDHIDRRRRIMWLTDVGRARVGAYIASLRRHFDPALQR